MLEQYTGTLPYASEMFGIYQPLLGWRSKLISRRIEQVSLNVHSMLAAQMTSFNPKVAVQLKSAERTDHARSDAIIVRGLAPFRLPRGDQKRIASSIDSVTARVISQDLGSKPPDDWRPLVTYDKLTQTLKEVERLLAAPGQLQKNPEIQEYVHAFLTASNGQSSDGEALRALFERESSVAGYLSFLGSHAPSTLTHLFYAQLGADMIQAMTFNDPLLNFGRANREAILSPVGIVHLFREYFFEFDSFLGPAVGHHWLSPGGTVELVEINTRRVSTERTVESSLETTAKSESQTTTQDDIADAVKEENRNNTHFGFSNVAQYSSPTFQDTATTDFSLDNSKTSARESTHKQMRQQSEKLSGEIKKNFKTTFKIAEEVTDTSSKRYVLQNTTDKLVNYELRRKMRKVGVQVQDIGTQLCWVTFVDDPGRELGISKLVHIAKPADLSDMPQPDAPEMPKVVSQELNIPPIPFVGAEAGDTHIAYTDGTGSEYLGTHKEHIKTDFPQSVIFSQPQYTLQKVDLDPQGADALLSIRDEDFPDGTSTGTFTIHLDYVAWHGQSSIPVKATLVWAPSDGLKKRVNDEYIARLASYDAEKTRRFKEEFYEAARERIKAASNIQPRPAEDLREEERTVVYRALIKQLTSAGSGSRHVISELIRSIFDVDKMLYFVTPDWWAPQMHESGQHLGESPEKQALARQLVKRLFPAIVYAGPATSAVGAGAAGAAQPSANPGTAIPAEDIVDWGGAGEARRNNYYITEESAPAKLGSSLGWLLQLDGDDMRNAMLNSPWVKAVIPVRLGKERQAINWLKRAHVEGSDGLRSKYSASPEDPPELKSTPGHKVTIADALEYLIDRINEVKVRASTSVMPNPADPADPRNHFAGSLPTEAVFEHGFYPLQGGVKFDGAGTEQAIFSQWMEILPTDQIVALEVEYDPKTLQIKAPA